MQPRDKPVTQVCMGVDATACTTEFERILMGNWLGRCDRIMSAVLTQELRQDGFNTKEVNGESQQLINQSWQNYSNQSRPAASTGAISEPVKTGQR